MKQKQVTIFPKLTVASGHEPSTTPPLLQAASATLDCAQCARQMTSKPDVIHVKVPRHTHTHTHKGMGEALFACSELLV